jgi:hypothetical protein
MTTKNLKSSIPSHRIDVSKINSIKELIFSQGIDSLDRCLDDSLFIMPQKIDELSGHLNNMDYTACIEEEYGFCGMEYYQVIS